MSTPSCLSTLMSAPSPSEDTRTLWHAHVVVRTFVPEINIFPPTPALKAYKFHSQVESITQTIYNQMERNTICN